MSQEGENEGLPFRLKAYTSHIKKLSVQEVLELPVAKENLLGWDFAKKAILDPSSPEAEAFRKVPNYKKLRFVFPDTLTKSRGAVEFLRSALEGGDSFEGHIGGTDHLWRWNFRTVHKRK